MTTTYKQCNRCTETPGQLVRVGGKVEPLCYTCWNPLRGCQSVKVLDWINRYGKLQFGNTK